MALSDEQKTEKIKRIIINRFENIGELEALITLLKNLGCWPKIKILLHADWVAAAEQKDINIQKESDEKADILALDEEIDTY